MLHDLDPTWRYLEGFCMKNWGFPPKGDDHFCNPMATQPLSDVK